MFGQNKERKKLFDGGERGGNCAPIRATTAREIQTTIRIIASICSGIPSISSDPATGLRLLLLGRRIESISSSPFIIPYNIHTYFEHQSHDSYPFFFLKKKVIQIFD
jgi:hypothetical protein